MAGQVTAREILAQLDRAYGGDGAKRRADAAAAREQQRLEEESRILPVIKRALMGAAIPAAFLSNPVGLVAGGALALDGVKNFIDDPTATNAAFAGLGLLPGVKPGLAAVRSARAAGNTRRAAAAAEKFVARPGVVEAPKFTQPDLVKGMSQVGRRHLDDLKAGEDIATRMSAPAPAAPAPAPFKQPGLVKGMSSHGKPALADSKANDVLVANMGKSTSTLPPPAPAPAFKQPDMVRGLSSIGGQRLDDLLANEELLTKMGRPTTPPPAPFKQPKLTKGMGAEGGRHYDDLVANERMVKGMSQPQPAPSHAPATRTGTSWMPGSMGALDNMVAPKAAPATLVDDTAETLQVVDDVPVAQTNPSQGVVEDMLAGLDAALGKVPTAKAKRPDASFVHPADTSGGKFGFDELPELGESELTRLQELFKRVTGR